MYMCMSMCRTQAAHAPGAHTRAAHDLPPSVPALSPCACLCLPSFLALPFLSLGLPPTLPLSLPASVQRRSLYCVAGRYALPGLVVYSTGYLTGVRRSPTWLGAHAAV